MRARLTRPTPTPDPLPPAEARPVVLRGVGTSGQVVLRLHLAEEEALPKVVAIRDPGPSDVLVDVGARAPVSGRPHDGRPRRPRRPDRPVVVDAPRDAPDDVPEREGPARRPRAGRTVGPPEVDSLEKTPLRPLFRPSPGSCTGCRPPPRLRKSVVAYKGRGPTPRESCRRPLRHSVSPLWVGTGVEVPDPDEEGVGRHSLGDPVPLSWSQSPFLSVPHISFLPVL